MNKLSAYEKINVEEAARIIVYFFHNKPALLTLLMEDLLAYSATPYKAIAPGWYENYKLHTAENKKEK